METVDARGLACPQPVVLTRRAMENGFPLTVLVDNDTAAANVTRMAKTAGWHADVAKKQTDLFEIALNPAPEPTRGPADAPRSIGPIVVFLASERVGEGDPELGSLLMRAFLHTLQEVEPRPDHIICMNSGVRLATEGSPVVEDLRALAEDGVQVWLCGTCLDYLGLTGEVAVGTVSNMYSLAELLLSAGHVVRP